MASEGESGAAPAEPRDKASLLRRIDESRARFEAALAAVGDQQAPLRDDGWSARDIAGHVAVWERRLARDIEAARRLLAAGANITAHSWNGLDNEPIHAAAANKGNVAMVAMLLDAGAQVNARQHGGFTPLHQAAQNGDAELVTLLLSRGARRSLVTDNDLSAYDLAYEAGYHELAARLS